MLEALNIRLVMFLLPFDKFYRSEKRILHGLVENVSLPCIHTISAHTHTQKILLKSQPRPCSLIFHKFQL